MKTISIKSNEFRILVLVVVLFVLSSFLAQEYGEWLREREAAMGVWAVLGFIGITAIDVLLAIVTVMPLIPVAAAIWGPFGAGVFVSLGWILGSMLAFWLGRRYGAQAICRLFNLCEVAGYKDFFPKKHLFWMLVLARIFLPVDLISYAVGIFTNMSGWSYFLSSLIGIAVFSFAFAYGSGIPLPLQIIFGIIILIIFVLMYQKARKSYLSWLKDNK